MTHPLKPSLRTTNHQPNKHCHRSNHGHTLFVWARWAQETEKMWILNRPWMTSSSHIISDSSVTTIAPPAHPRSMPLPNLGIESARYVSPWRQVVHGDPSWTAWTCPGWCFFEVRDKGLARSYPGWWVSKSNFLWHLGRWHSWQATSVVWRHMRIRQSYFSI